MNLLSESFFNRDACTVARELLGKVIRRKYKQQWLAARIIETEAYYLEDKGSHASLGFTEKRKALFMQAGTIYMYYAHGRDSLNISCRGKGNAVLIKSAFPYQDALSEALSIESMQQLNPHPSGKTRSLEKLCNGQSLLCRSLNLKVTEWDQKTFDSQQFYIDDVHNVPEKTIQTTRLGIPKGRDESLPYRFIDYDFVKYCTKNPLTTRTYQKLLIAPATQKMVYQ
ncbi:DNA-3-methyladenine glycosylase [Methyloprofundus sp.]|uniref:DNA-3-methyladenine glycosylase n=1 Tax=Methyloprofundus sp. TaxID=2020875 RepID=UPI003D0BF884